MLKKVRTPIKRSLDLTYRRLREKGIDLYRSGMRKHFGFLLRHFFARFFRYARVDEEQLEEIRKAASKGTIVYVMHHRSLLDYLFFNNLLLRNNLPLAEYSNEINMLPFLSWKEALRTIGAKIAYFLRRGWLPNPVESGWLRDQVADGTTALLFLHRRATFFEWARRRPPQAGITEQLIQAQRKSSKPVYLVPLVLLWRKQADKHKKTLLDILFGEAESPGQLRKLVGFIRNYKRAVARIGDPLDLSSFLETRPETEPLRITAKRVRWACLHYLYRERRVVTGARLMPAEKVKKRIKKNW